MSIRAATDLRRKVRAATAPATGMPGFCPRSSRDVPRAVDEVLCSPGRPLSPATRAFMESRFARDFGHVRVHADARAAESAQTLSAMAFTLGRDVVFGSGQYSPQTASGRRLLSHELAHVMQQEGPAAGPSLILRRSPKVGGTVAEDTNAQGRRINRGEMQALQPGLDLARRIVARTVSRMQRVVHVLMTKDPPLVAPEDKTAADLFTAHFKSSRHADAMDIKDTFTAILHKLAHLGQRSFRAVPDEDIQLKKEGTLAYVVIADRPDIIYVAESIFSGSLTVDSPAVAPVKGANVMVGPGTSTVSAGPRLIAEALIHEAAHLVGAYHSGGAFGLGLFAGPPHPVSSFHQASFNAYVYNRFAFSLEGDAQ